jgi:DNA-binding winged helix-turn-helix (wHTH) protein/Tol biopolymer transport system component
MDNISTPIYEFADFRLDPTLQILVGPAGETIPLQSRAFATLHYLVERSGQVVEKPALMNAVWPRTVVAENNLNQCILQLRKVLGESAGDRRFILTVPGRGFKFVARVTVVAHEPMAPPASQDAAPAAGRAEAATEEPVQAARGKTRRSWSVAAACLVLGVAAGYWMLGATPHAVTSPAEYEQLTDVDDSATAPVMSPDGRLLAFVRNGSWLFGDGQIWLKRLPDGDYVKLTNADGFVFAPAFTPDGGRVAYTVVDRSLVSWSTWTVPITGGEPTKVLPNASGLTYVGPHQVMFSEFRTGIHLGIVTSTEARADQRDVYWPAHERGMAHFSYLSPDRQSVLAVEMDGTGNFQRCRLVSFDGHSNGVAVGPVGGGCIAAAWSVDGAWMYFSSYVAGHAHLWRQHFPDGIPEQITYGPTEEQTVSASPDGRSLLTSIGMGQVTLWLHSAGGERALTTDGDAYDPWLSIDARRVYFLSSSGISAQTALTRMEVASGRRELLLPGFDVGEFDVSADEQQVVFTIVREGVPQIWLAPLDRHAPPRMLVRGADEPRFGGGMVYFRHLGDKDNYLHRVSPEGTNESRVLPTPIINLYGVAPDGRFAAVDRPLEGALAAAWLIGTEDSRAQYLGQGVFPSRWSRDGKSLYVDNASPTDPARYGHAAVVRLGADGLPPGPIVPLPASVELIPHPAGNLSVGKDTSVYVYARSSSLRNIYRIPLH